VTGVEGVPLEPDMGLPVISLWIFSLEERMSLGDGWGRGGVGAGCECVRGWGVGLQRYCTNASTARGHVQACTPSTCPQNKVRNEPGL
jgi:hypothetical protein